MVPVETFTTPSSNCTGLVSVRLFDEPHSGAVSSPLRQKAIPAFCRVKPLVPLFHGTLDISLLIFFCKGFALVIELFALAESQFKFDEITFNIYF